MGSDPGGDPEHPFTTGVFRRRRSAGIVSPMLHFFGATRAHRAFTAYDATTGGIEALTRAMALDLGPYGIRNALMPGSIDTSGLDVGERTLRGENVSLGRIGEPFDMPGAALFLASDDAGYITGDVIRIDGGMLAQQRSATVDIMPLRVSRTSRTFESAAFLSPVRGSSVR